VLFSHVAISILYGNEYKDGAVVLIIYVFTNLAINMGVAQSLWLLNERKPIVNLMKTLIGAVIAIIGNWLVIPYWGLNGVAMVAVIAMLTSAIFSNYFFSKNISDEGLQNDPNWLAWVTEKAGNASIVSLTKSASYLMTIEPFSMVRNFILNHSKLHIQDDSGIGFKYITASNRPYTLYGKFTRVISLFKNSMQQDLALKFKSDSTIKPLPFAIGYNLIFNETNLEVIH
jgi:hypothetical protein